MNVFNIDIKKYSALLTPPFLRSLSFAALLNAFISPLEDLYQSFLINRKQNIIRLQFNYQTCSIEYRLNDAFDPVERRIKIVRAVKYEALFLYTEAEDDTQHSKTKWLFSDEDPIYLRTEGELYSIYDFVVEIPDTNINIFQLRAEIDFYKLITKTYEIKIVT